MNADNIFEIIIILLIILIVLCIVIRVRRLSNINEVREHFSGIKEYLSTDNNETNMASEIRGNTAEIKEINNK